MKISHFIPAILCLNLVACAPNISSNHYYADNVGHAEDVRFGKIIKRRTVEVASRNDESGTLAGTAAGATLGSGIGGDVRANILGALGGAVIGGVAGHEVGQRVGNQTGIQYIIKLDSGKMLSIVQGPNPPLCKGQRVMVLTGGCRDRVVAA